MKRTILLTTLVIVFNTTFAQNAIKIHTNDNMKTVILVDNIEKLSFEMLAVGDIYQGGIVFYVDVSGEHGLIAALFDQGGGMNVEWDNGTHSVTGAAGDGIGAGADNTSIIIDKYGWGPYPAWICKSLTEGGYMDWYSPSKYELFLMYTNLHQNGLGGFHSNNYWCSTEASDNSAWEQNFNDGSQTSQSKSSRYFVRAVRAF